jgi:hypothetical protein
MDWIQFVLFIFALGGMYWSLKSDSQRDRDRAYEDRKELLTLIRNSEKESKESRERMEHLREQMAQETKEFHGRMCTLEERYLQILQNKAKVT